MKSKDIKKCRLCFSNNLKLIINFGSVPIGNNLLRNEKLSLKAKKYPLLVYQCSECEHFQLGYEVSKSILYATNYTYLSGIGKSFHNHLSKYADWSIKNCSLKKGDKVLDIGSNDGTCLSYFKKKKMNVIGIDPAKLPSKLANNKGIKTYNEFFDNKSARKIKSIHGEIDYITSHNVLAHVSNLNEVMKNIFFLLKKDGFFCFEVGYFLKVMENNYFDTIYHEHLDYHHAKPLIIFLQRIGFSIVEISTNKVQGGSLRILCKKDFKKKLFYKANYFLQKENESMINNEVLVKKWVSEIKTSMNAINLIIDKSNKEKKIICGYGAPTKASLIIKTLDLYDKLSYIVEDNPLKINRYMPRSKIKILDRKTLQKKHPDIVIVFAWNFFSDIIKMLKKDKLKNLTVLVPLPKLKMYRI